MPVQILTRYTAWTGDKTVKYRVSTDLSKEDLLATARRCFEETEVMQETDLFESANGALIPRKMEEKTCLADIALTIEETSLEPKLQAWIRPCDISAEKQPAQTKTPNQADSLKLESQPVGDSLGFSDDVLNEYDQATVTSCSSYFDLSLAQNAGALSHEDSAIVIANSALGYGLNVSLHETACYRLPVVKSLLPKDVHFASMNTVAISSTITYTDREASYAIGGWYEAGIIAESSWVKDSINNDTLPTQIPNKGEVYATGRYTHSFCRVSLIGQPEPHPDFKAAVLRALELEGDERRRNALNAVFNRWGHFFVDGTTMGGTKYINAVCRVNNSSSTTELKILARDALVKKMRLHANPDTNISNEINTFDSCTLMTSGGHMNDTSIDAWTASLINWKLWRSTRPTSIRPITELFDDDIQRQISALEPPVHKIEQTGAYAILAKLAIPLYHVNRPGVDHLYTTEFHEVISRKEKGENYMGIIGRVLPTPEMGAVPLFRTCSGEHHFYTADPVELNDRILHHNGKVDSEPHAGYIFRIQVEGTIPLFHLYCSDRAQHGYLTDPETIDNWCKQYRYENKGVVCYLFPA